MQRTSRKIDLVFQKFLIFFLFYFALHCTHHDGETYPRKVGSNSDFMILNKWMPSLRNFRIRFHQNLTYHSYSVSVNPNKIVNVIRDVNASTTVKPLLQPTNKTFLFY